MTLDQLLEASGYRARWLADRIGISETMFNYLRTGKRRMTDAMADRFAAAMRGRGPTAAQIIRAAQQTARQPAT